MSIKTTMTIRYDVICDDCHEWDTNSFGFACFDKAIQTFRSTGWIILSENHAYCPACAKKRGLKNE